MDRPLDWAAPGAWRSALATPAGVLGAIAFGLFAVLVFEEGGFPATVWYPAALFLLGLLVVRLVVLRALVVRPALSAALVFLAAFTAWSFASIGWAGVKGDAWEGSNRTLLYLAVYALLVSVRWTVPAALVALGGFAFAVVAIGVVTLVGASISDDPGEFFIGGRLSEPLGYQNAVAAVFLLAFWPLLLLATRRELTPALRAPALAAAGVSLELAFLAQSRAALLALPLTLAVYLMLVPGRARAVLALVVLAAVVGAATATLKEVYPAVRADAADAELQGALEAVGLSALALLVAGAVWALLDRRLELSARALALVRRVLVAAGSLAAIVLAALVLVSDPLGRGQEAWDDLNVDESSSTLGRGLSTNRYDLWRVAWGTFERVPVHGAGADNFAVDYLRERRSLEETLYPHSLQLRTLSQLGVIGSALLGGFFVCGLVAAVRRRTEPFAGAVAGTAVTVFAYWLIHGSVDWFWEIPALTCPALACLAVAGGLEVHERPTRSASARLMVASAAVLAGLALVPPWLAEKKMSQATAEWRTDPGAAFSRLENGRSLNPLSDEPDMLAGAIASRLNDTGRMRSAFERALARNSYNWYAQFELGILAASEGNRREALKRLRLAQALDPREPAIALALEQVRSGRKVSRSDYDRLFFERSEAIVD